MAVHCNMKQADNNYRVECAIKKCTEQIDIMLYIFKIMWTMFYTIQPNVNKQKTPENSIIFINFKEFNVKVDIALGSLSSLLLMHALLLYHVHIIYI